MCMKKKINVLKTEYSLSRCSGVMDVALFHYLSCTDLFKTSIQILMDFVLINASEGSHFVQILVQACL
jgi:hypothetical protein